VARTNPQRSLAPTARGLWIGAAAGALGAAILVVLLSLGSIFFGWSSPLVAFAFFAFVGALVTALWWLLSRLIARVPAFYLWALGGAFPALVLPFIYAGRPTALAFGAALAAVASLCGGACGYFVVTWRARAASRPKALIAALVLVVSVLLAVATSTWLFGKGASVDAPVDASRLREDTIPAALDAPDPTQQGNYAVRMLSYGSGQDPHHAEYAKDAALRSKTIDGSAFLKSWRGLTGAARSRYWHASPEALPLNGVIYLPDAKGAFPLVLIVHGNYMMQGRSDRAFGYLASFLASHGYVAVTVDENFLNSAWYNTFGESPETSARGWLLLEHLRQLLEWNASAGHALFGRMDPQHIALVGHSRGGEAVAVAAALNGLDRNPEDARISLAYHFPIKAVVAIAPVDGQYQPAGRSIELRNVDYLLLHGAYDGDVISFGGSAQYARTRFDGTGDWFKSAVYIYGANHSNFTTEWAGAEKPRPSNLLFNTQPLLAAADQRTIARTYVLAFLETSLRGMRSYLPLFQDARVGRRWLPKTVYLTQYEQAATRWIATFEEDFDAQSATAAGVKLSGSGLSVWREGDIELKRGPNGNHAVSLGWERGGASYLIESSAPLPLRADGRLTFALAAPADVRNRQPISFHIELADDAGHVATVPLSEFSYLQPPLVAEYMKHAALDRFPPSEPVFQTFMLPLQWFLRRDPALDVGKVHRLRLVFDETPSGLILLDDLGALAAD
jgi:dienelactone hydrolase